MQPARKKAAAFFSNRLPEIFALAGAVLYFIESRLYALTQLSVLDEGAYLLKGYWFATGQYLPYQEFGPFTNHMPLAFLIPGYVQAWFGPGLRPARYFAVLVAMLFLLGLWLLLRRWGGRWWAAAALWAVALNPATIKMYSVGVTQGLIAAMLVWTLLLTLGRERPAWQIVLGSALAGAMALTRLNMTPVLIMGALYLLWEHGWRRGLGLATSGLALWLLGHLLYWPGILQMWANYTPAALTPFLDAWRVPVEAQVSWTSGTQLHGRWQSLLEGLRFNFLPVVAALGAILLWPRHSKEWRESASRRAASYLLALFLLLLGMHAFASLGQNYCVFCFPLYFAFFSFLPFLSFVIVWRHQLEGYSPRRQRLAATAPPLLFALAAYGAYPLLGAEVPASAWVRDLLNSEVPRFTGLLPQGGTLPLWGLLENRFAWSFAESFRVVQDLLGYLLFVLAGLLMGSLIVLAARRDDWLADAWRALQAKHLISRLMILFLALGALLSPTPLLGGGYQTYDCDEDIIAAYERLGAELDERVPAGSLVFWRGGRSAVPLLYLTDARTFPPQLNGDYTYRLGGSAQALERMGLWGPHLLEDWLQTADIILIEEDLYRTWMQAALESGHYDAQLPTAPLSACSPASQILIYTYQP